jgi:PST family polysaccharide transporter
MTDPRDIDRASVRGGLVSLTGRFGTTVVGLLSIAVMSRLLTPADFGIVAMATTFMALGEIFRDSGLTNAAIQAKDLSRGQRDNLWWINTGLGLAVGMAFALASPTIARFFHEPMVVWVSLALAVTFVMSGATTQHRASLVREMRFTAMALADVVSSAVGLVAAIIAALLGAGLWSLVTQTLVSGLVSTSAVLVIGGWVPRRYSRNEDMRGLLRFGIPMFGTAIVQYAASNLDSILLGRLLGSEILGEYNRAVRVARQPLNAIRSPLSIVALSTLSKQQNDTRLLARYAQAGQVLMGYPLVLISGLLAIYSFEAVNFFLGPGWDSASTYLALIAIGEGLNTLAMTGGWIYSAMGRARALLTYTLVSASVRITLLLALGIQFGAVGAATACAVAPIILWPLSLMWAGRATGVRTAPLIANSYKIVAVAGVCLAPSAIVLHLVDWTSATRLSFGIPVTLAMIAICSLVPSVRRDYSQITRALGLALRRTRM